MVDDDDEEEEECSAIVDAVEDDAWFERRGLGVANALMMMDGSSWIRRRMRERMILVSDFIVSVSFELPAILFYLNHLTTTTMFMFSHALIATLLLH